MNKEFGKSLSEHGVHIIDGFTGTGTFIVRLLQSGVIKKGDLLYKYINDIHANEIVLLAYYIAAINIEETFHELSEKKEYTPFDGIVLTDTFQLYDNKYENNEYILDTLEENNARANRQKELPITVCIGNPPYSVGQKSQNDNAQNLKYKNLDSAIANTYVKFSMAQSNKATYDAYIRAFRWATDRIEENGIISFITNGAYIDNKGMDGFRKCLLEEFSSIYVFNLRGNQRTSGEMSKKEGGKIFGSGSRTPVAITCLIKNKNKEKDGYIHYYDIGDYLTREQKLSIIKKFENVSNIEWKMIKPDQNNDWINKKSDKFGKFIPLINKENSVFTISSSGVTTARDYWVYNFNKSSLLNNMNKMIDTYNMEVKKNLMNINDIKNSVTKDETKISWSRALLNSLRNGKEKYLDCNKVTEALYRPFCKEYFYYSLDFNECQYKTRRIFKEKNPTIIINGTSSGKDFSCLMTDKVFNFHTLSTSMAFPLYYYDDTESNQTSFMINENKYDGISNWIYEKVIEKYENKSVAKEDVFYYVYGILHSKDYRETFKFDLKKSLPSIPLVDNYEDFIKFSKSGKKLADLHLNYEKISPYKDCEIIKNNDNYKVIKMKFGKNKDKSIIQYNDNIIIKNIPSKAYEYVVNGKSAIEWIMERYAITTDKKSGIVNDPNDWCKEVNDEKYIFNLLLRIINVSVKTVDIINSLPKLNFEG